jgi:hypothetical protein
MCFVLHQLALNPKQVVPVVVMELADFSHPGSISLHLPPPQLMRTITPQTSVASVALMIGFACGRGITLPLLL